MDNNSDQPIEATPTVENNPTVTETVTEEPVIESEVVNMPDAPVTTNSIPQVIEVESKPITTETLVVETTESPTTENPTVAEPTVEDMFTIRSDETGDKVYVVKNKKRYWVKNPETLAQLGFYLGKEKRIPFSELLGFPEGEPVDMTVPEAVYPWDKPEQEKSNEPTNPTQIWQ